MSYRRIYDEKAFAEAMHDRQDFSKDYMMDWQRCNELRVYAKWLKWKKLQEIGIDYNDLSKVQEREIEVWIEEQLKDFMIRSGNMEYDYSKWCVMLEKIAKQTRKYKLRICEKIPITENEYNKLANVENETYRKMLFGMLVDAKMWALNNTKIDDPGEKIDFWLKSEFQQIATKMKLTHWKQWRDEFLPFMRIEGFADKKIFKWNNYKMIFADDDPDSKVVEYITDWEHIDLHYARLFEGANIGECEKCGALFRRRTNNQKFCSAHKGYQKIGYRFGKCCDCGKEFAVDARNQRKIRCDACQTIKRREDKRIAAARRREKEKIAI